jgi:hypothetical protein
LQKKEGKKKPTPPPLPFVHVDRPHPPPSAQIASPGTALPYSLVTGDQSRSAASGFAKTSPPLPHHSEQPPRIVLPCINRCLTPPTHSPCCRDPRRTPTTTRSSRHRRTPSSHRASTASPMPCHVGERRCLLPCQACPP